MSRGAFKNRPVLDLISLAFRSLIRVFHSSHLRRGVYNGALIHSTAYLVDYILDSISVSKNSAAIYVSAEKDNLRNHRGPTIGFTRSVDCCKLNSCKSANYDRSNFTAVLYFFQIGSDEIASVYAKRHNPYGARIIRGEEFLCGMAH